jgi:hypothetical protein
MKPEQIEIIKEHLSEVVVKTVNGKIDQLNLKLDNYIDNDMAWKDRAEPLVKAYENSSWLWKIVLNVMKFVVLVGAVIGAWLIIKKEI